MNNIVKPSSKHLIFIIFGLCIISFEVYPSLTTSSCGAISWIAQIAASIIFALFAVLLTAISMKTNCYDIVNIYISAFGKILGTFFLFLLFINAILVLCECSSLEANTLNNNILVDTPVWFFLIFFLIATIYAVSKGKDAVLIITILATLLIFFANIISMILLIKSMDFSYLPPIIENGFFHNLGCAIFKFISLFSFIIFMFPYIEDMTGKEKLKKNIFIAIIIIGLIEAFSLFQMLTTLGVQRQSNIYYPKLIQTQLIDYFGFLENGEIYIIFEIIGGLFVKYILILYSLTLMLDKLNIKNKYMLYIISCVTFIISFWASLNTFRLFYMLKYYIYICFFNLIIIPLIAFIVFYFKQKKKISQNK